VLLSTVQASPVVQYSMQECLVFEHGAGKVGLRYVCDFLRMRGNNEFNA